MFSDLVISGNVKPTHTRWTMLVSAAVQVCLLGILIIIPILIVEPLPKSFLTTMLVAPTPPPPAPPPAAAAVVVRHNPVAHLIQHGQLMTPRVIPKDIKNIKEEAEPPDTGAVVGGVPGGIPGGTAGGVLNGIIGSTGSGGPPPPPAPAPVRIRIGGNVIAAKVRNQTIPIYPAVAKSARVQGTVVLHAIISKDGKIEQVTYISGPPLLVRAAQDAVLRWTYAPTYLNGVAVEVDTTISVVFTLN
jgi:periplasmic protein TonB